MFPWRLKAVIAAFAVSVLYSEDEETEVRKDLGFSGLHQGTSKESRVKVEKAGAPL